jgi:pimeloyl-ACP methyl ester carboxylesterase
MSKLPEALWLSTSPSLQNLHQPLLRRLSQYIAVAQWEYYQSADEPASLEIALTLLHDYLKQYHRPVHLIGHSTGGLLGLLYARRYPQRVRSLTLLAVGAQPAIDWQAHYYVHRQLLACSRDIILAQMVRNLMGPQSFGATKQLIRALEQDLAMSLSPHSLFKRDSIASGGADVPMLVCGSQDDMVVDVNQLSQWQAWLKPCDRIWQCPKGRHFFHYFYPQSVTEAMLDFWQTATVATMLTRL